MPFKVLHGFFVFLRRSFRVERAQISSLASLWILLPRIQSITAGFKFPDHNDFSTVRGTRTQILLSRVSTLKLFKSTLAGILQAISRRNFEAKREQRGENREIHRQMAGKTPIFTGMPETAAGDVDTANLRGNGGDNEDRDERG